MTFKIVRDTREIEPAPPFYPGPWGIVNEQGEFLNPSPFTDSGDAERFRRAKATKRREA